MFFDAAISGSSFAAQELRAALQGRGYTVAYKTLNSLTDVTASTRFVLALRSSSPATSRYATEGGAALPTVGEQAYLPCARRRRDPGAAYWVFGGDSRGIIYGALDIAATIRLSDVTLTATGTALLIDHLNAVRVSGLTRATPLVASPMAPRIAFRGNRFSIDGGLRSGMVVSIRAFSMNGSLVHAQSMVVGSKNRIQGAVLPRGIGRGSYVAQVSVGGREQMSKTLPIDR